MNIICPHCNFSKTVDPVRIPDRPVRVNCPKCSKAFTLDKSELPGNTTVPAMLTRPDEQITCPACGLAQSQSDRCSGCGVIYAKFQIRQMENGAGTQDAATVNRNLAGQHSQAEHPNPGLQPKAGFWIRVVASLIDSCLLFAVQFVLSLMIGLIVGLLGIAAEGDPGVNLVIWMFGVSLSICYAVFFTGYCGQTPGKMALRIKVIRIDGSSITYGRAALREIPGKFISGILLGIGYLMVAFDSQKQGLHDKIADTYVIKL